MSSLKPRFLLSAILPFAAALMPGNAQTFTSTDVISTPNDGGLSTTPIPANIYPSTITVPSTVTGTVATVQVNLNNMVSQGSNSNNLQGFCFTEMMLVSPDNRQLELMGGSVGDCSGTDGITMQLKDGNSPMPNGTALPTGTQSYEPSAYFASNQFGVYPTGPSPTTPEHFPQTRGNGTLNGVFGGDVAAGAWKLYVMDNSGSPVTVNGWNLILTVNAAAVTTTTTISSNLNPSFTAAPNSSVTFTATVSSASAAPTGTVDFTLDGTTISGCGAATLTAATSTSSTATCGTSITTQGNHAINAIYNPTGSFSTSSTDTALIQLVEFHSTVSGTQFCNTGSISIPGGAEEPLIYPSIISVSGLTNSVANLSVSLTGVSGTVGLFAGRFLLVSPGGNDLELLSDVGEAANQPSVNLVIADDNPSVPGNATLSSGTFEPTDLQNHADTYPQAPGIDPQVPNTLNFPQPFGSTTLLGAFDNATANGNWSLYIVNSDDSTSDVITVAGGWCLNLTLNTGTPTTTTMTATPNPALAGAAVTFSATVKSGSNPVTTGTVTFTEDGVAPAGTVSGNNVVTVNGSGVTTFTTSGLAEGDHTITATYTSGGAFNTSSTSVVERIDNASTNTSLNSNPVTYCNPGAILIPAGSGGPDNIGAANPNPSNIFVSGLAGTINSVNLMLNSFHTLIPTFETSLLVGPGANKVNTLDFFSATGASNSTVASGNFTFSDSAASLVPQSAYSAGTFKPTSYTGNDTFFSSISGFYSLPAGPYQYAATAGTSTLTNVYGGSNGNGTWSLYWNQLEHENASGVDNGWCLQFTENAPDLSIASSHSPADFRQGQTGSTITYTVTNNGPGSTGGTVQVVIAGGTLPTGLTATALSGTGWACVLGTLTCTDSTSVASGTVFGPITLTVSVAANAPASESVSGVVSGSLDNTPNNDTATEVITVEQVADLTVTKSHTGNFKQGDAADTYTITVSNITGHGPTVGTVTLVDNLPTGLTAVSLTGTNWTCDVTTLTCTRSDVLNSPGSYDPITLTVSVANNAPASVTNTAIVSGGGELNTANDTANDVTTVIQVADLTIAKSHTGNFTQGQVGATYSVVVSNAPSQGPTSGTVTMTDVLPTGLTPTAAAGTGWGCTIATQTVTCTRTDALASGSSYPAITVTVTVANNAPASVTNTATVAGGGELNTANDSASDPTTISAASDLTIAKSHVGNFTQGQVGATYSVVVSNAPNVGPTTGTVTMTDILPTGLTPTAAAGTGWGCTIATQTVTCTRTDALASGSSYPAITITVTVANNAPASVTNTANVAGGGELNTANDSASDVTTINAVSDLTIAKSHTGNFTQGQVGATYSVVVSNAANQGPTSGTVTMTDVLPTGLTPTAAAGTGWGCGIASQTVTCTRTDVLASGSSYPAITITVTVANNAPASVTNTATVAGGGELNTANDSASDVTTINAVADLTIAKSHPGNFTQGQVGATYSVVVSNAANQGLTSGTVTMTDTLPTGLTPTAAAGTGWGCTVASQTVTCTRTDVLASGSSYPTITVTVTVANNAPASVTNTATVAGGGELNTANDSASDPTTIGAVSDLTIAKSHTGNFTQGQVGAAYSIVVSNAPNQGPTSGTVTMTDVLPTGLTPTAAAGTGWGCTVGSQTVTCTRSDVLASGASYPAITVTVTVANNAPAVVTNTATVSGGGEVNAANDTSSDVTTITAVADLTIAKSHVGNFTQGQVGAAYSIVVSNAPNQGPTSGTVTVADTLPTGLTPTAAAGTGWGCGIASQAVTCTRSDVLASGASYPAVTVTVTVANNAPAVVTNTATVSGGGEVNTANDTSSDVTTITAVADLTIAKSHSGNFTQGQVGAAYSIVVSNAPNQGPTSGTVTVADILPTGLTPTAAAGTGWNCGIASQAVTCTRSDVLASGSSYAAITVTVNVAANAPSTVTNTATVSGGGELNTANDSASDVTTILPGAKWTITKAHSGNFFQGEVGVNYTIAVSNTGAAPTEAASVSVTDTLPSGLTATAINGSGWTCVLGTLTCTRSDVLTNGSSYPPITLTVTVANNAPATVTNTVTVSGGGVANSANASDTAIVAPGPDLTIAKSHIGTFSQGQTGANYTITVSNVGGSPSVGTVQVVDTLPLGLTATALTGTGWACVLGTLTCTRSDALAASSSYPPITLTVTVALNASASLNNAASVSGGGDVNTANNTATDPTTIVPGQLWGITKTDSGDFFQGENGATYTITVSDIGTAPTTGTATVVDTLPAGLTATAISGSGWTCTLSTLTCTRADSLANGHAYPPITITVSIATNAAATIINSATVSGGGAVNPATGRDTTAVAKGPDLVVTKVHTGNFTAGQIGATYTLTVSNLGGAATTGTVSVVDTLPSGLTATALSGTGWTCVLSTLTCTRPDSLPSFNAYPAISLTVNVASGAPSQVINMAAVSGGGDINTTNNSVSDVTNINSSTQFLLTTLVLPAGSGTITPATGSFPSGEVVSIDALPATGYVFTGFSGALTGTANPQGLAITTPKTVTANFAPGPTSLGGALGLKTGPMNARIWPILIGDNGPGVALNANVASFVLTQRTGTTCTPVLLTPLPAAVQGPIAPGAQGTVNLTLDFSSCQPDVLFEFSSNLSANNGAATGVLIRLSQP